MSSEHHDEDLSDGSIDENDYIPQGWVGRMLGHGGLGRFALALLIVFAVIPLAMNSTLWALHYFDIISMRAMVFLLFVLTVIYVCFLAIALSSVARAVRRVTHPEETKKTK